MADFMNIPIERYGFRLPLRLSDKEVGVVLDADDRIVLEADPDAGSPEEHADIIASLMVLMVNAHHGFRVPADIADADRDEPEPSTSTAVA